MYETNRKQNVTTSSFCDVDIASTTTLLRRNTNNLSLESLYRRELELDGGESPLDHALRY
jgi:hypothetical protein